MKLLKLMPLVAMVMLLAGCNKPAGELVGTSKGTSFKESNPYGMVFVRKGSFLMGPNSESNLFAQHDDNVMVTVKAFWMDETEITNNEYRQFVNWVRDSIAYTRLIGEDGVNSEYAIKQKSANEDDEEAVAVINWKKKIPWEKRMIPEDPLGEALAPMFYENGRGALNTCCLQYRYTYMNMDEAVKAKNKFDVVRGRYPDGAEVRVDTFWISEEDGTIRDTTIKRDLREPKDLLTNVIICVYPDTMVWMRDFQFAYNDPMVFGYFRMPGYNEYPVVGVTWEQAQAFCRWRTDFYKAHNKTEANIYRLPSEAEWEYAARGGRRMAMYPWGDKYARDEKGCFLANFKPYRGSYNDDMGTMTSAVAQFSPNDFGLFDMSGNVAEWTSSAYLNTTNGYVHDMNPDFQYSARKNDPDILKRKVTKGGSWKDISYYLQCGVRAYEYQYESRSYIGFRCVRSYVGD